MKVRLLIAFWGHPAGTRGRIDSRGWLRLKGSPKARITPADFGRLFREAS